MFEINLLPETYRRSQRSTPLKMLALAVLIAVVAVLAFKVSMNLTRAIPEARREVDSLKREKESLTQQVQETEELTKEYLGYRARIDAVRTLYIGRVIWAKLLMDVKALVAKNQGPTGCRLWLAKLTAREDGDFSIDGYSSGPQQNVAQLPYIGLFKDFDVYSPAILPEKQEIENLEERRLELEKAHPDEAARPESVRKEMASLEARKLELADVRSGRIAVQPFVKFIKPGTFNVGAQTWQTVSGGSGAPDAPSNAWRFSASFKLTPPGADEEK